jgi:Na+/alanine symporter
MAIGMSLGIIHGMKDRKVGMNPGVGRQTNSKMRTPVEQLMVFMLSPLISDMFANFATGLTLEIDSSSSCEDSCS